MSKKLLKFGRWPSKISAELVAGKTLRFQMVQALDDMVYWTESRPEEKGRSVLMCSRLNQQPTELLPPPYSARSKIHEYGGGEFLATPKIIFFINAVDQQIWAVDNAPFLTTSGLREQSAPPDSLIEPRKITHAPSLRFADLVFDQPAQPLDLRR